MRSDLQYQYYNGSRATLARPCNASFPGEVGQPVMEAVRNRVASNVLAVNSLVS
jgi:hypothetical protein